MKKIRKILAVLLAAAMVLSLCSGLTVLADDDTDYSGTCGDNLTWEFDEDTGTLTISGSGEMEDYSSGGSPWYDIRSLITSVIIEDGVTSIGDYAFYFCYGLTDIAIPDSVEFILEGAFDGCTGLSDVYYSGSEQDWSSITIYDSNDYLASATIHYSSTGPGTSGTDDEESAETDTESDSEDSTGTDDEDSTGTDDSDSEEISGTAFAVYSEDDYSLRFYREEEDDIPEEGDTYNGLTVTEIYTGFEENVYGISYDTPWQDISSYVKIVSFEDIISPVSCREWFYGFSSCETMDLDNLDTSDTTETVYMFRGCSSLTALDLSGLDTSNVTDMSYMFDGCSSLEELDLGSFDTSDATGMAGMFYNCSALTELDLSGFDTSDVTHMSSMFYGCSSLTELDLSGFDTSDVTGMGSMFYNCSKLSSLDLSSFDTSNVTSMYRMFYCCHWLTELDLSNFDTSEVRTMQQMFYYCGYLQELDLSNFDTSKVTDMYQMFARCSALKTLNLSGFENTNAENMSRMFQDCYYLTELNLDGFATPAATDLSYMFYGCYRLTSLDLSSFDTSNVTTMAWMFDGCSSLEELDLSGFDTSGVTSMSYMFRNCSDLSVIYATNWSEEAVNCTSYSNMFSGCTSLPGYSSNEVTLTCANYDSGYFTDPSTKCTHVWSDPEWTWTDNYSCATAVFTCSECGKTRTETSSDIIITYDCDRSDISYTASVEGPDGETYSDTQSVWAILEHVYGDPEWTWADDYSWAEAVFTCTLCGKTLEVSTTGVTSTAESDGIYYSASVTGPDGETYTGSTYAASTVEPDTWSFSNSEGDFNIISYSWSWSDLRWEKANNGYYITSEDYERLVSNLDASEAMKFLWTEETAVKSGYSVFADVYDMIYSYFNVDGYDIYEYRDWTGSCEGMSTWVCLTAAGVLNASDIDGSTSLLSDYECSDEVQSAINYYHMQQLLSACQNLAAEFMAEEQEDQLDILKELAAAASSGGNLLRIAYAWYEIENGEPVLDDDGEYDYSAHCIVGYGLEYGDYTDYVYAYLADRIADSEYTCRILTYDPSNSGEEYYIYISDDGHWCIPGYGIISSSKEIEEWDAAEDNNGHFKLITSSTDEINLIDYNTGQISSLESEAANFNSLLSLSGSSYSVSWDGYSADISGAIVSNNTCDEDIYVITNSGITSDGESGGTAFTAVLPDSSSFTVTSDEASAFCLDTGNYLTLAVSSSEGSITFDSAGGASASAQEDSTLYISVTADDGYTNLVWNTIEVAKEGASELSASLEEEGLVISGGDLSDVYIYATADDEDDDIGISFSTEEESVIITNTDSGEIQVLTDADKDGEYETEIEYETLTVSISQAAVTLESDSFTYTGSAIEPSVTVTLDGTELIQGEDYTVSYSENTEAGTATVTVTGTGSYSGTVSVQFEIICTHSYEAAVTEATCTDQGYTTYTCTVCGDSYITDYTDAPGHTAGEAVAENIVEATCTEDGSYDSVVYCAVCGEEISRETITVDALGHSYDDGAVTKEATEDADGIMTYTCSVCGNTYTESIKYAADESSGGEDGDTGGEDSSSGDADGGGSSSGDTGGEDGSSGDADGGGGDSSSVDTDDGDDSSDIADDGESSSDSTDSGDDSSDGADSETGDDSDEAATGDDNMALLWMVLAAFAALGCAVSLKRRFDR